MENVKLIELLELVKQSIIDRHLTFDSGICKVLEILFKEHKLTYSECVYLKRFIYLNKPTNLNVFSEFTENEYWSNNDCYWWSTMFKAPETRKIRIDYLTKLIDNIK